MGIIEDLTGEIKSGITSVLTSTETALSGLSPASAVGVGSVAGIVVGSGITSLVARKISKKRKKSKHKASGKRGTRHKKHKLKFGSKAYRKKYLGKHRQKKPHTAGNRKDTSHKRIRFTKHNQPYIILANGRARFIKKSSVTRARKLKGGRY